MYPYISIGPYSLPSYSLCIGIAFFLVFIVSFRIGPKSGFLPCVMVQCFLFGGIFMLIGAKLLYFITSLSWDGMVFYGGLLGGVLGICLVAKIYHISSLCLLDFYCPFIAFLHGIGRIGCLLGGCCYGKPYDGPFAITYPHNALTRELADSSRFPTPVMESIGLLALCIFLLYLLRKKFSHRIPDGTLFGIYLVAYSVLRFFLEFTRGDAIRGFFYGLSTSGWISILLFFTGILVFCYSNKKSDNI